MRTAGDHAEAGDRVTLMATVASAHDSHGAAFPPATLERDPRGVSGGRRQGRGRPSARRRTAGQAERMASPPPVRLPRLLDSRQETCPAIRTAPAL